MRKNFGSKPWVYPLPVYILATYNEDGTADAMMLTWGGIHSMKELGIYISSEHRTTENIIRTGCFTVSMAEEKHLAACDYVGSVSAKENPDKVNRTGFHTIKAEYIEAPLITELPMTLECRLLNYDKKKCRLTAEIVNVSADESILTGSQIDPEKLRPVTFDTIHNTYLALGNKVGDVYQEWKKLERLC